MRIQTLTEDELRSIAAGNNDIEELIARAHWHAERKLDDLREIINTGS